MSISLITGCPVCKYFLGSVRFCIPFPSVDYCFLSVLFRLEPGIWVVTLFMVGSDSDGDLTMKVRVDRKLAEVGTVCRRGGR